MTRKQKRLSIIAAGLGFLGLATALTFYALGQKASFFYMPTDMAEASPAPDQRVRLGGLVEEGSVRRGEGTAVSFVVTDTTATVPVTYVGILPDLFREGQGIIAEGKLGPDGVFTADTVLAKHDETYMPKEVADSLRAKGVWQDDAAEATQ
jgi:cytochrome c-type biogenesis protein CcmE